MPLSVKIMMRIEEREETDLIKAAQLADSYVLLLKLHPGRCHWYDSQCPY